MIELGPAAPTLVDLGPRIGHLSFRVTDLSLARRELLGRGVEAAWAPRNLDYGRDAGFRDADGLLFRILEPGGDLVPEQNGAIPPAELRLHHVSFLTRDVRGAEAFYAEKLGLETVYRFVEEGLPKLIFMADPFYEEGAHDFLLEIMGPPFLPREATIVDRLGGPCPDHLCYTAADVAGWFQGCLAAGFGRSEDPLYVPELDTELCYLFDPDGVEVEIMTPPRPQAFGSATVG